MNNKIMATKTANNTFGRAISLSYPGESFLIFVVHVANVTILHCSVVDRHVIGVVVVIASCCRFFQVEAHLV